MKKDFSSFSEAILLELSGESSDGFVTKGRFAGSFLLGLENVELLSLNLSLFLKLSNKGGFGPSALGSEVAEGAELSVGLESEDLEGLGHDNSLLVIVRERNTLENLQATESGGALGGFVRHHAAGGFPEEA